MLIVMFTSIINGVVTRSIYFGKKLVRIWDSCFDILSIRKARWHEGIIFRSLLLIWNQLIAIDWKNEVHHNIRLKSNCHLAVILFVQYKNGNFNLPWKRLSMHLWHRGKVCKRTAHIFGLCDDRLLYLWRLWMFQPFFTSLL